MLFRSRRILRFVQTPWQDVKGGAVQSDLGDGNLSYARFFLWLQGDLLIELERTGLDVAAAEAVKTQEIDQRYFDERRFVGAVITEVVVDEFGEVLVLLSNRTFLEVCHGPLGNKLRGDDFQGWDDEGKGTRFFRYWEREIVKPWGLE